MAKRTFWQRITLWNRYHPSFGERLDLAFQYSLFVDCASPWDVINRVKRMDVRELKSLDQSWDRRKEDPMRGSPADIQRRYIKIELKRRGRATFSKSQLFKYYSSTRSYQCMNPSRPLM